MSYQRSCLMEDGYSISSRVVFKEGCGTIKSCVQGRVVAIKCHVHERVIKSHVNGRAGEHQESCSRNGVGPFRFVFKGGCWPLKVMFMGGWVNIRSHI